MQPSSDRPDDGMSRQLKRYGPIVAIVAVVAVIAAVIAFSSGGDDEGKEVATDVVEEGDLPEGVVTFAMATEQGIEADFGEHCDTETGEVAVPFFFAPPCYAGVADNGGATARGVTEDSIKVVVYSGLDNDPVLGLFLDAAGVEDTPAQVQETYEIYTDFFNEYYQTYGRTVEIEFIEGTGTAIGEVEARADAQRAVAMEPFAVWGGPVLTTAWADELAANEIFCFGCLGGGTQEWYEERAPYPLPVGKIAQQGQQLLVEYIDKKLAGRPAVHAGDESLQDQERTFAYLYVEINEESVQLADMLVEDLGSAGIEGVEAVPFTFDPGRLQEQADVIVAQLKAQGVTSVIVAGDPLTPANFTQAATNQEYFPEWIITGATLTDSTVFARTYDQEQWSHAFGVSALTARTQPELASSFRLVEWFTGEDPPAANTNPVLFPQPALFFAAVQLAGPNLTPQSFRDGLYSFEPTADVVLQPSISFGDHGVWEEPDFGGVDDVTEIWWDPEAEGPDEIRRDGQGMYQYIDGGTRYTPGEWTDEESKAFDPDGAVAIYEEPPEGEEVKDYPSPAG